MKAKEKISLLVSGKLTMKEIQALEDQEQREAAEELEAAKEMKEAEKLPEEVDYKELYEELQKQIKNEEKDPAPEIDYKALYEEEAAKVTKLQQQNVNKNLKSEDNKSESINDIMLRAYSHS